MDCLSGKYCRARHRQNRRAIKPSSIRACRRRWRFCQHPHIAFYRGCPAEFPQSHARAVVGMNLRRSRSSKSQNCQMLRRSPDVHRGEPQLLATPATATSLRTSEQQRTPDIDCRRQRFAMKIFTAAGTRLGLPVSVEDAVFACGANTIICLYHIFIPRIFDAYQFSELIHCLKITQCRDTRLRSDIVTYRLTWICNVTSPGAAH